ncbi:uncharacterized protein LOC129809245 [Phlebotomus papatasi]|uniref:uncharacterized protein LOC129807691 n=1 Tax=Phlebotomus papatasi TaxID=29031 RepID=UPI002483C53C|nr:uncharacterized protein LOC129807691 [Phlebotomus papatasi]XP_055713111.1 uncharacterized protein LOC129807692 [Phlebotomus papatasi]XP_055715029.1 uncharacterized protein LOC129809245 [Phlebotomus papatasi]
MSSEGFNKFSSVSKILFSDRGDNAINLAVDAFVQMMLQRKSVTELIELLHSKQNCELYNDILKTLKELVKKGVKLPPSEKKKFIMSIRNFTDDALSEQAYEILSNEEAIDDSSEPAPKRRKIDQDATANHDIKVPMDAYAEDKDDDQSNGQLHIQSGVGRQSNVSDDLVIHDDSANMVKILNKSRNYSEFFKITQLIINFRLNKPKDTSIEKWMENGFDAVIEEIRKDSKSNADRVILKIFVTEEPTEKAIYIGMRPLDALTSHIILEYMEKVSV